MNKILEHGPSVGKITLSVDTWGQKNMLPCCCSVTKLCPTLCSSWNAPGQTSLSFTICWRWLKLMSIESVMPSNHLTFCFPFSSYLQSFPTPGSFLVSWLFTSGGQSFRASVSASVLPMNIQDCFPLGLTVLISLLSKGLSRVFSSTTVHKSISSLVLSLLYGPTLTICTLSYLLPKYSEGTHTR